MLLYNSPGVLHSSQNPLIQLPYRYLVKSTLIWVLSNTGHSLKTTLIIIIITIIIISYAWQTNQSRGSNSQHSHPSPHHHREAPEAYRLVKTTCKNMATKNGQYTHNTTSTIHNGYYCWLHESLKPLNPLNPELNPICYLLALLGAHHFLHVSRIRVKLLTLRLLMSYIYIYGAPILDVSRSHTTTHHSR